MSHGGVIVAAMVLCFLVLHDSGVAQAPPQTYIVGGGRGGWNVDISNWPNGKKFIAGDFLVFSYNKRFHNVVALKDKNAYNKCNARGASVLKKYNTGNDKIQLLTGMNYFICSNSTYCRNSKMKIAIKATASG